MSAMRFPLLMFGLVLLALSAALIAGMPAGQVLTVTLPLFRLSAAPAGQVVWLVWVMAAVGAPAAVVGFLLHTPWFRPQPTQPARRAAPLLDRLRPNGDLSFLLASPWREIVIFAALLLVSLLACLAGHLSVPRAVLLSAFATAAIGAAIHAVQALEAEPFEMQSHWGGLGGGMGGWRLSRAAVLILLALGFAGAAVGACYQPADSGKGTQDAPKKDQKAGSTGEAPLRVVIRNG